MTSRSISVSLAAMFLIAGLAIAEPEIEVRYFSGVPQVSITGSYPGSHYTIWRASHPEGPYSSITRLDVLCLGPCFGEDFEAMPGATYWYRFDLVLEDGSRVSFGPFPVTISPTLAPRVRASVHPNPSRAASRVELFLAGAPSEPALNADAAVFDAQGRRVRTVFRGQLDRGLTRLAWDGRGDSGAELGPGVYFLRLASPLGSSITRFVRIR